MASESQGRFQKKRERRGVVVVADGTTSPEGMPKSFQESISVATSGQQERSHFSLISICELDKLAGSLPKSQGRKVPLHGKQHDIGA